METTSEKQLHARFIEYHCPDCGFVETQGLGPCPACIEPPRQTEKIPCRCGPCFSAKLDKAMPGARELYHKRLAREEARAAKAAKGKANG
jgi:hypothetical protein